MVWRTGSEYLEAEASMSGIPDSASVALTPHGETSLTASQACLYMDLKPSTDPAALTAALIPEMEERAVFSYTLRTMLLTQTFASASRTSTTQSPRTRLNLQQGMPVMLSMQLLSAASCE